MEQARIQVMMTTAMMLILMMMMLADVLQGKNVQLCNLFNPVMMFT